MGWPWQRQEKQAESEPRLEPLSDRQYKALFFSLLEVVDSPEQVRARLGGREGDRSFLSWLRRFGRSLLKNPATHEALTQQMIALAAINLGALSDLAREIGEQLLAKATEQPSEEALPTEAAAHESANSGHVLTEEEDKQAEFYLQQGNEAFMQGDFIGAIAAYDQALHIKPDDHETLYNKGVLLSHLGRYEEAIATYDQALHVKPNDHKALNNKGVSLNDLGRYEEAIVAYDQALHIKPDDHEALNNRGVSLANLGQYEEAITAYDQTLHIKPDDHEAWINRGIAADSSFKCNTPVAFSLPASLQDKSLDQRGYEGQIACYTIGLSHVQKSENPEGWGQLYRYKGRAHYFHGRFLPNAKRYLREAVAAYEVALTTLTAFPSNHLEVIQDAIRAHLGLNQPEKTSKYRQQGLEVFNQLLNDALTPTQKQRLEQQFSGFSQIQVDSLIREGNPTQALQTAERYKNRTLGWILDTWQETITIPSWADIQTLLAPSTAALYWHLSPDSLTTFLLTAEASAPIAFTQPTAELEPWLKKWNQQYQAYRGKGKAAEANKDFDAWRTGLQSSLDELKEILKISELEENLPNVSQLLLIPHRDLHCLPLHALFSDHFTISHLPSLKVGLKLKQRATLTHLALSCPC